MSEHSHLVFHKSSYSSPRQENCMEVAEFSGGAALRDSQNRGHGHLTLPAEEWAAFLRAVKAGEL